MAQSTIDLMSEPNLHFLIENRGAQKGDIIHVEDIKAVIKKIAEERPSKAKGKIFQKLIVEVEENQLTN